MKGWDTSYNRYRLGMFKKKGQVKPRLVHEWIAGKWAIDRVCLRKNVKSNPDWFTSVLLVGSRGM